MVDYLVTDTELTDVADAIREKGGTSEALTWPTGYVNAIEAIETGGGGESNAYIKATMPEYMVSGNSYIYTGAHYFAPIMAVGTPSETMQISTSNHYFLSSITRDDTGESVPYTTVSTTSRGGEYTFVMPNASVTYNLYYDD